MLLALACGWAGCFIGFDDHKLTGGGPADGGAVGAAGSGGDPAGPGPGAGGGPAGAVDGSAPAAIPSCDNFSSYAAGASIPNWVDGHGTWRIVATPHGLGQMMAASSNHDFFVGWYAADWTDQTVTATVDPAQSYDDNCVLARCTDAANYYELCVHNDHWQHMQGSQPQPGWNLRRMVAGSETQLASGGATSATSHTLTLHVHGSTLSVTIDGALQPDVSDGSLIHGAAGLGTESSGVFVNLCAVPM